MKALRLYSLLIALLAISVRASAGEIPAFDREAFLRVDTAPKQMTLSMTDCVGMALEHNSEIRVKRIAPRMAGDDVLIQKARFEPKLSFDFSIDEDFDLVNMSPLYTPTPAKERTSIYNAGFDQKLTSGADVAIDLLTVRSLTNSNMVLMNPAFDTIARATVTQPLLKGFGTEVNKADYLIAKNNQKKSDQEFIKGVIDVLTDVKKAYYEFLYSRKQYDVAVASLRRVESLHRIGEERYAKGLASDVDLLESEAETARFEEAVLAAGADVLRAEDNLKLITNLIDDPACWHTAIVLADPLAFVKQEVVLNDAVITAFDHRPDYEAAKLDLQNRDIAVVFYRNNMLPTLDLTGSYALNGLGKNIEKSMGHVGGGHYRDWSFGVAAKMPLFGDEEKGKYDRSKREKEQALIAFERLEERIILEVRNAVRNVDIRYRMLEASIKSKDAETKNYRAQESRFREGLVSAHDIINYQERLARAELNYVRGVIDYNITLLELARAEGTTLINDHIQLEEKGKAASL